MSRQENCSFYPGTSSKHSQSDHYAITGNPHLFGLDSFNLFQFRSPLFGFFWFVLAKKYAALNYVTKGD
jgi:hypothetical protein